MAPHKPQLPLLDVENVIPILNKIAILGGLSELQLYTIFRLLECVTYQKDELIFRQGDLPSHIYIIRHGRVRIVENIRYTPVELAEFQIGDCFGETSVIAIQQHTASAIAMERTELLVLTREALFTLYKTDPKLFGLLILNIAREACRRLNKTEEIMLHYVFDENH